jgi:hypothetical protein
MVVLLRTHVRAGAGPARKAKRAVTRSGKTKTPSGGCREGVIYRTVGCLLSAQFIPSRARDDGDGCEPPVDDCAEWSAKRHISNADIRHISRFVNIVSISA